VHGGELFVPTPAAEATALWAVVPGSRAWAFGAPTGTGASGPFDDAGATTDTVSAVWRVQGVRDQLVAVAGAQGAGWQAGAMSELINALAATAVDDYPGGIAYTYNALDALRARILVVEQGGKAFPHGDNIGAPDDAGTGKWAGILDGAGLEPGMYSWWNAIPVGLERADTVQDKAKARAYVKRAVALHDRLFVIIAVGSVAQEVVKAVGTNIKVVKSRSPLRTNNGQRDDIREAFAEARAYAYPVGLDRD
jgi:hypothetical protein